MDKFGLIGHPLGHSMSPLIHEKLFGLSGLSGCSYELIDIAPENLSTDVENLKRLKGFNITIPHKTAIIPFTDSLAESALRYNSVNCIHNLDGKFIGYNTDCDGFIRSAGMLPIGGNVLILGCGGVGRMIAIETALHGADITLAVIEQDIQNAQLLMAEILSKCANASVKICLINEISGNYDLLINATPVGMFPKTDNCAVSDEIIRNCESVFDVIYNPTETLLMKKARAMGKTAVGGAAMLVYQADSGEFNPEDISEIIKDVEKAVDSMNS